MKKVLSSLALASMLALSVGCGGGSGTSAPPTPVTPPGTAAGVMGKGVTPPGGGVMGVTPPGDGKGKTQ